MSQQLLEIPSAKTNPELNKKLWNEFNSKLPSIISPDLVDISEQCVSLTVNANDSQFDLYSENLFTYFGLLVDNGHYEVAADLFVKIKMSKCSKLCNKIADHKPVVEKLLLFFSSKMYI